MTERLDDTVLAAGAFSFALKASKFKSMSQVQGATTEAIARLGLTAAASGIVSGPKASSPNPFHFSNWPADWVRLYISEDFLLADPIPRWARNSGQALVWTELIKRLPARDRGRKVIKAAASQGYTEGIIIPMRARDNSLGLISMGGNRRSLSPPEQAFLTSIGRSAFDAADRIENRNRSGSASPILTIREIECLTLLVRGHSDEQISKLLGMSVRTVRFHFNNAREKFPATSRTHLAALAVAQGYVVL
jgi:DNA-binding CsgD family transcriptional regulator